MNNEQKFSWFAIILIFICFVGYLALVPIIGFDRAWGVFGLAGLIGLPPLFLRRKNSPKGVSFDERDRQIARKATQAGGMASYVTFVFGLMGTWGIQTYKGNVTVHLDMLVILTLLGLMALFLVRSVVLLVLYHRGNSYAE